MTVILVLGTFLVFILIDFFLNRKQVEQIPVQEAAPAAQPLLSSASIEGILVPDQLRYHAGHTWLSESATTWCESARTRWRRASLTPWRRSKFRFLAGGFARPEGVHVDPPMASRPSCCRRPRARSPRSTPRFCATPHCC